MVGRPYLNYIFHRVNKNFPMPDVSGMSMFFPTDRQVRQLRLCSPAAWVIL